MRRFEHRYLGWDRFPEPLASIEIEQFFGLTGAELACVQARRTRCTGWPWPCTSAS